MRKRIWGMLAIIALLLVSMINVGATSKTRDNAINWLRSKEGQYVGNGQCVGLIAEYYKYLGVSTVSGNACDYATNALPSGWTREKGGVPQKGDILVYTGGYGHVAIAETTQYSWHQNWGSQYVQWVDRYYSNSFYASSENVTKTYWGCIRPNFDSYTTAPTDCKISSNLTSIGVGDTVTFSYNIKGATNKNLGIDKDGKRYGNKAVSSDSGTVSYTFNEAGTYCCIIEGSNSKGYSCSNGVYITVINSTPTDCKISSNLTSIGVGDTVTFTYNIKGATQKGLGIDKNGKRYGNKTVSSDSGTVSYTFNEAGTYCCIIEGGNSKGYGCSHGVYITVREKKSPSQAVITSISEGTDIKATTFTWKASDYADKYIVYIKYQDDTWSSYGATVTGTSCSFQLPAGNYKVDIQAKNPYGYSDSGYKNFTVSPTYYTIKYDNNISSQTKTHSKNITLSTQKPTRTGYTFKNWNTSANGSGKSYAPGATYSDNANLTLYAQWTPNTYKVTFNANGGVVSSSNKNITYNSTYGELPTPTRNGYKFKGWFTSPTGGTQVTKSTTVTATSNLTLYAQWELTKVYTKSTVSKVDNTYTR